MNTEILIIGGGASGMMCAVQAAWLGHEVIVLEHEKQPCRKLNITGKGRCNVTNNCDVQTVMANIPRNAKFLFSALSRFTPADTMAFFESLGIGLKTEREQGLSGKRQGAGHLRRSYKRRENRGCAYRTRRRAIPYH